ncbi:hypothetical protein, partial [Candidatus Protofrankia californiensis]|uniref:hypothetical protein n=1 Tax=Candidatus Protofrankia californiensis TaxID=1839754 RepID=UPI0013ECC09C
GSCGGGLRQRNSALETPGQIITTGDTITVRLERNAYHPVLRKAAIPDTAIPWWGGRTLHFEYA